MTTTIQRTSKPLKLQLVISAWIFWFALFFWFLQFGQPGENGGISWPAVATVIGGIWYVVTKVHIWWQHA